MTGLAGGCGAACRELNACRCHICYHPPSINQPPPVSLQGKTQEREYFYGADFSREAVPEAWRRRWRDPQHNDTLHLPAANPFISTDFAMQEVRS